MQIDVNRESGLKPIKVAQYRSSLISGIYDTSYCLRPLSFLLLGLECFYVPGFNDKILKGEKLW